MATKKQLRKKANETTDLLQELALSIMTAPVSKSIKKMTAAAIIVSLSRMFKLQVKGKTIDKTKRDMERVERMNK